MPADGVCSEILQRRSRGIARPQTKGLKIAQHFPGLAYVNGEGVRPDDAEAARWFARAAAQGFAQAQFMLGLMTLDGRGVPKDLLHGYAFLVMAGQGGVRSAIRVVQKLALTEAQHGQAQQIIDDWKPKPESPLAGIASPREEELLGLDRHIGEVVDPSTWPASAIGVVALRISTRMAGARARSLHPGSC
jgi:uncharacterized protein